MDPKNKNNVLTVTTTLQKPIHQNNTQEAKTKNNQKAIQRQWWKEHFQSFWCSFLQNRTRKWTSSLFTPPTCDVDPGLEEYMLRKMKWGRGDKDSI